MPGLTKGKPEGTPTNGDCLGEGLWVAGSVLFSRPMLVGDFPLSVVNRPPTRIFRASRTPSLDNPARLRGISPAWQLYQMNSQV